MTHSNTDSVSDYQELFWDKELRGVSLLCLWAEPYRYVLLTFFTVSRLSGFINNDKVLHQKL